MLKRGGILRGAVTVALLRAEVERCAREAKTKKTTATAEDVTPVFVIDGFPRSTDNLEQLQQHVSGTHWGGANESELSSRSHCFACLFVAHARVFSFAFVYSCASSAPLTVFSSSKATTLLCVADCSPALVATMCRR